MDGAGSIGDERKCKHTQTTKTINSSRAGLASVGVFFSVSCLICIAMQCSQVLVTLWGCHIQLLVWLHPFPLPHSPGPFGPDENSVAKGKKGG